MEKDNIKELEKIFNSEKFIGNVCMSYRHDFGLMTDKERDLLIFQCKEWMRSIINNLSYHKD